jgi:hypothetical protein
MRKVGWYLASIAALTLALAVSAAGPQRMQVSDIRGLVSGNLVIGPDQPNPLPIGRGGYPLGFAFAPGRPELTYCALEQEAQGFVSVLRLAQVENLWPVTRIRPVPRVNSLGQTVYLPRPYQTELPFSQRERELLKLMPPSPAGPAARYLSGPILWSPDGARFALFCLQGEFFRPPLKRDLWVVDCNGQKRELTRGALVTEAVWSPDGKWLAYADGADRTGGLWLAAAGEGGGKRIGPGASDLNWSADGSRLYYRGEKGRGQYYLLAGGETGDGALPPPAALPWQISPNRKYLARRAGSQLEIIDRATGTRLMSLSAEEFGGWYPDSILFAFFDSRGKLTLTALNGVHRGHLLELEQPAGLSPVAGLPSVQWSSPSQQEGEGSDKAAVSWLALLEAGGLRVFRLNHHTPSLHEQAALHPPTPEGEQSMILSSMRQIALASLMYASDYDEMFAPQKNVERAILPYMKESELFDRPGFPKQPIFKYLTDGIPVAAGSDPAATPLWLVDLGGKQICLGFADGHAGWYDREQAEDILRREGIVPPPSPRRN